MQRVGPERIRAGGFKHVHAMIAVLAVRRGEMHIPAASRNAVPAPKFRGYMVPGGASKSPVSFPVRSGGPSYAGRFRGWLRKKGRYCPDAERSKDRRFGDGIDKQPSIRCGPGRGGGQQLDRDGHRPPPIQQLRLSCCTSCGRAAASCWSRPDRPRRLYNSGRLPSSIATASNPRPEWRDPETAGLSAGPVRGHSKTAGASAFASGNQERLAEILAIERHLFRQRHSGQPGDRRNRSTARNGAAIVHRALRRRGPSIPAPKQ